ncbi:hypothetical protein VTK26DRAFT_4749 [Humicola hyalothermophila]
MARLFTAPQFDKRADDAAGTSRCALFSRVPTIAATLKLIMGLMRKILAGRRSNTHHDDDDHNGSPEPSTLSNPPHALDTLPTLPVPRRPLTATPAHPQHHNSPLFKLPPELRQQVYRILLSGREIHLDMRYTAAETSTPHSTAGASLFPYRRWLWRGSTCHRHPDAHPISDRCGWGGPPPTACRLFDSPCGIGREVMGLMLCCRLAYREVVDVLYRENTLHVSTGSIVLYTESLMPPERAGAVTSLIYRVTEESVWDYAHEHLGIVGGLPAYKTLIGRVPIAFPGLMKLEVIVQGSLETGRASWRDYLVPLDAEAVKDCLLSAMDAAVARFGRPLAGCVLAMRHTAFDRVMEGERAAAERVGSRPGAWLQFWRPVIVGWGDRSVETGYWVRRVSPDQRTGAELDLSYNTLQF